MPHVRLGVAIMLAEPLRSEVEGLRRALGDGARARIDPHITLVAPFNLPEVELPAAMEVLRLAARRRVPFEFTISGPATFWPQNTVIYLAVGEGAADLGALHQDILQPPVYERSSRPFVPHVTVADEMDSERNPAALSVLADFEVATRCDRLHLLRRPEGRRWEQIGEFPFGTVIRGRGGLELELTPGEILDPQASGWARQAWVAEGWADGGLPATFGIAARREGQVVGAAEGRLHPGGQCLLARIIVDPACRGQGVGTALVDQVLVVAIEAGCDAVEVRPPSDSAAARWFSGRGFRAAGRLADWVEGKELVRMRRHLDR